MRARRNRYFCRLFWDEMDLLSRFSGVLWAAQLGKSMLEVWLGILPHPKSSIPYMGLWSGSVGYSFFLCDHGGCLAVLSNQYGGESRPECPAGPVLVYTTEWLVVLFGFRCIGLIVFRLYLIFQQSGCRCSWFAKKKHKLNWWPKDTIIRLWKKNTLFVLIAYYLLLLPVV